MLETLRELNATASFNRWAGVEVVSAGEGEVVIRLPWQPEVLGQYAGFLHSALIGGLLDTACGFAAFTVAGKVMASHFSVNCLAPGIGRMFTCRGQVVKAGRKQVFASAELLAEGDDGGQKLIATGNAILVPV